MQDWDYFLHDGKPSVRGEWKPAVVAGDFVWCRPSLYRRHSHRPRHVLRWYLRDAIVDALSNRLQEPDSLQLATVSIPPAAAIQDIWQFSECVCNTLEIAEESGTAGGNPKVALQACSGTCD